MTTASVLAEVIGAVLVLVGLSVLNKKYFSAVMSDLEKVKGLTWTVGIITFVMGAVTVGLYNVWSYNWLVVITIVGWLMILKGVFITLFPNTSISTYRKVGSSVFIVIAGVIAIILGVVLFYAGFTA